jgi:hypothetical protein
VRDEVVESHLARGEQAQAGATVARPGLGPVALGLVDPDLVDAEDGQLVAQQLDLETDLGDTGRDGGQDHLAAPAAASISTRKSERKINRTPVDSIRCPTLISSGAPTTNSLTITTAAYLMHRLSIMRV